jgi:glycosyltransferase involved in cell wall biosynthesis
MRILFINNSLIDFNSKKINKIGGIEHCNIELAKQLSKLDHEVNIASLINKKQKFHNIKNFPIDFIFSINLKKVCDVAISSNFSKGFNNQKNIIKILWMHNELQIEKSIRKNELLPIFKNRPHCVFVSKYLKKKTSNLFPFKSRVVLSNGCSELFLNNKRKNKKKPIFIWTVKREQGLEEIIKIWRDFVIKKNPLVELHIYGLKKKLNKKNIKNYNNAGIKFFGIVDRKILAIKYAYSTAMIHPGYDETFCISALEALASGLPVITIDRSALSERVSNNINGYKVKSFEEMGKAIIKIANNNHEWKKLSDNAINLSKNYAWSNIAFLWDNYLKKIQLFERS